VKDAIKLSELQSRRLSEKVGVEVPREFDAAREDAWIDVIQTMDTLYADLVDNQIELEHKNRELEDAQQFIRSVLGAMTDVLIVCDTSGRIQQVNAALETLTGKSESALLGQRLEVLFAPESLPMIQEFPARLGADAVSDCEVNLVDSEGGSAPLAMNCSSRYDQQGRLVGMVLIGRPVGELRKAYRDLNSAHEALKQTQLQLVHTEKMASLGRLVAGVAHELNNPISFVFGNVHSLKRYGDRLIRYLEATDAGTDARTLQLLREELRIDHIVSDMGSLIDGTLEGAQRVSDIVKDLRRYSASRAESVSVFDLVEVIHTATQWVVKASRIKPDIVPDLPERLEIEGRKGHVHQILVNLVQNALDVMDGMEPARLEISCVRTPATALIRVRDHGPGIPDEELGKIFDPFYTTKPVGKGTGLGLYISYGLATDLGGDLRAANHSEGGAVFTLEIPLNGESIA
jgi:two-component system sensor histidine kinase HupT/HoxJ